MKKQRFTTIANMLKNVAQSFLKGWVYSNVYIVFVIGFLVAQSYVLVGAVMDFNYFWFATSATLFLYPLHRLLGSLSIQESTPIERILWARKHKQALIPLVICGGVLSVYYFFQLSSELRWWFVPLAAISLSYSLPIPWLKGSRKRLRDIPYVKIYAIAITVSVITLLIPLSNADLTTTELILLFFSRVLLVLAVTIPFDIRDVHLDQPYGLKTLPLVLGVQRAKSLSLLLVSGFTLFNFTLFFFFSTFSIYFFMVLVASDVYAAFWLNKADENKSEFFYAFGVEGIFIVQSAAVILMSFLP